MMADERFAPDDSRPRRSDRFVPWLLAATAAAPRLVGLGLRPLHHDEGTNWIFLLRLLRERIYQYDPANYHGPLFYYLGVLPLALFGATPVTLRIVPGLLGMALAPLAWCLRREMGRFGALAAALLLALSPSLVYYSRDAIHEIELVFLTLLLAVAVLRAFRSGRDSWWMIAGVAAGGVVATKEVYPLVFGSLFLAAALSRPERRKGRRAAQVLAFCVPAVLVASAFYSRFFTDLEALSGPARALRLWGARAAGGDGHTKAWWYFLGILARQEGAILFPALAGAVIALWRRSRSALFFLVWAGLTLAAYSSVAYKTPWLVLNMALPLALLAGVAFDAAWRMRPAARFRPAVALALAIAAGASLRQAIIVSFLRYDDEAMPLVYVQTSRQALKLVERVEDAAGRTSEGHALPIEILSPDYLPLNWYLRDFTRVAYFGHLIDHPGAPIVIARSDGADEVAGRLGPGYGRADYDLRQGVRLALFVRRDLAPGL